MDAISIVLLATAALCFFFLLRQRNSNSSQNEPPLELGFRDMVSMFKHRKRFSTPPEMRLKQSEVYRANFGATFYFLNSYRAIYEAFVEQGDVFSGRQKGIFIEAIGNHRGIVNTDGLLWQEHRRFMLRLLREFGLGKSVVSDLIQEEVRAMIEALESKIGDPVSTTEIFNSTTNNIIARLMFGERSGTDDADFKEFVDRFSEALTFNFFNIIPIAFPFVLKIPGVKNRFRIVRSMQYMADYVEKKIQNQRLTFNVDEIDQATCICEALLIEQARQDGSNPGGHTFTDAQIARDMLDLFTAGTETTASALTWAMLLLSIYGDIQRKVIDEIDQSIGRERSPTMTDRQNVPYVCAVLDEILRFSSFIPNNAIHRTTAPTKVVGYDIPADSLVQSNLQGIHRDPRTWTKPDEFYPEHFLNSDGQYEPSKFLIPFSIGKRACLGESLARAEYFIAFVSIFQNFETLLENSNVDFDTIFEGRWGIICHPQPHKIIFRSRDR